MCEGANDTRNNGGQCPDYGPAKLYWRECGVDLQPRHEHPCWTEAKRRDRGVQRTVRAPNS